jgi:peptide/nickel transport system substrate-binding protein
MITNRLAKLMLVFVLVIGAVGSIHRTAAADNKNLVIGLAEDTASLDPAREFEPGAQIVHKVTYQTLVTWPDNSVDQIIPDLATKWDISADGMTYTFTLKDGIVFSTGNPMTADDVVFSFNRAKNIKGNPSFLATTIKEVKATDKSTVVLTLTAPDPAILAKLVFPVFAVIDSKTAKEHGATDAADADKTDTAEKWLNNNSIGTGPYILTKWDQQNETTLVRNEKYNGTAPYFDNVIFKNIPQAATQKQSLEAGDIDIALDLTPDQTASIKSNPDLALYEGLNNYMFFLLINQDKNISGSLADAKVQDAVRKALDYAGIVKLAGGSAVTPASVIPVGFAGAYPADKAYKQDVEGAKKILADAGVKDITVDLEYPDFTYSGINFGTMAQKIQADLKAIGITVNLKPAEVQVALQNYRDGKEAMGLWFWGPDYIDPLDYVEFLPEGVVGKRANWTDANSDDEIKAIRDKVKVETDLTKRNELFAKMQDYLQAKGPFVPFLQPGLQIGYSATLKGFAYNAEWRINPATLSR